MAQVVTIVESGDACCRQEGHRLNRCAIWTSDPSGFPGKAGGRSFRRQLRSGRSSGRLRDRPGFVHPPSCGAWSWRLQIRYRSRCCKVHPSAGFLWPGSPSRFPALGHKRGAPLSNVFRSRFPEHVYRVDTRLGHGFCRRSRVFSEPRRSFADHRQGRTRNCPASRTS